MIKRPTNEGEDTTWQAIYMDLITMLMILFLLLWVISAGKSESKSSGFPFKSLNIGENSFTSGSADLTGEAKKQILDAVLYQSKQPFLPKVGYDKEEEQYRILMVHGHTDHAPPKGSKNPHEANMKYGYDRAMSVYKVLKDEYKGLVKQGKNELPLDHTDKVLISVCSHSFSYPIHNSKLVNGKNALPSDTKEKANRRVNITASVITKEELKKFTGNE